MSAVRRDGVRRRDELLDAALRCFVDRGLLETGIEDIRKAAGASPSSVYHLFGGMPGIVVALLTRTFERLLGHIADRIRDTDTAEAAVRTLVDAHLEWVGDHPDEARVMYQAMALELAGRRKNDLLAVKATLKKPVFDHLDRFVSTGELPRWSPLTIELILLGPSHEVCRRYLAGADLDLEWMRATLPELAWRTLTSTGDHDAAEARSSAVRPASDE
jgi:AcrR family transcriptional regulator